MSRERVPLGQHGGRGGVDRKQRVGLRLRRRWVFAGVGTDGNADEFGGGPQRCHRCAAFRSGALDDDLGAFDAYDFTISEFRGAEAADRDAQADVAVDAMAHGREHVLRDCMQGVSSRRERRGQRREHDHKLTAHVRH